VFGVFDYTGNDTGELSVISAAFLGLGVVLWAIAGDPARHESLITPVIASLVIFIIFLLWGWVRHVYTGRNVLPPIAIDIIWVVWIWASRRQTDKVGKTGHPVPSHK
jgi:hypothetical protein